MGCFGATSLPACVLVAHVPQALFNFLPNMSWPKHPPFAGMQLYTDTLTGAGVCMSILIKENLLSSQELNGR